MFICVYMSARTHHHPSHQSLSQEKVDSSNDDVEKNNSVVLLSILEPIIPVESPDHTEISNSIAQDILLSPVKNQQNPTEYHHHSLQVINLQSERSSEEESEKDDLNKISGEWFDKNDDKPDEKNDDNLSVFSTVKQQDSIGSSDIPSNDTTPEKSNAQTTLFSVSSKPVIGYLDGTTLTHKHFNNIIEIKTSPLIDHKTDNVHIITNNNTYSTYHQTTSHTFLPNHHKFSDINKGAFAKDLSLLINSVPISSGKPLFKRNFIGRHKDPIILKTSHITSLKTIDCCDYESVHTYKQKNKSQDLHQSNDFLSLSLSPPLSRRRDMPALRGPFVSL